jgi:hypothetical protein
MSDFEFNQPIEDQSIEDDEPIFPDPSEEFVPPDPSSFPQPTAEDLHAAEVIGRLIHYGYQPSPEPLLPDDWDPAYEAVTEVLHEDQRVRFQAFVDAMKDDPLFVLKLNEVNRAMPRTVDRMLQTREAYSADDFMTSPPELAWTIPDLFVRPSVNFLVGEPGSKKTFLATDLAVCIAMGKPWLGHPVNQSSVIFIDEETGLYQLWGRFAASLRAHAAPWGTPLRTISLGGFDLRDPQDAERLTHRVLNFQARFVVIDALANLMRGAGDGNIATVQPVLFQLRRLSEITEAAILILHHTNKGGDFRGTSAIAATADLMLQVRSAPADSYLEVSTLKARFYAPPPFAAHADFTAAQDGTPRIILKPAELTNDILPPQLPLSQPNAALAILSCLNAEPATLLSLAERLPSFSHNTLRNVMHQLKKSGLIHRVNRGQKGVQAVYGLRA